MADPEGLLITIDILAGTLSFSITEYLTGTVGNGVGVGVGIVKQSVIDKIVPNVPISIPHLELFLDTL